MIADIVGKSAPKKAIKAIGPYFSLMTIPVTTDKSELEPML